MPGRDYYLATASWLAQNVERPGLRILDCTVYLQPRTDGHRGFAIIPGREDWAKAHIPGSLFADIQNDLSDRGHELRFMMPSADQFAAAMAGYGVSDDSEVVLYDRAGSMWAARVWWMLRCFGFDNARILDGGWHAWESENHPISAKTEAVPPATFTPSVRPGLIADKEDVLAAITGGQVCIVDALNQAQYRGDVNGYGRPGHIASAVNVPSFGSAAVVDASTQRYLEIEQIRRLFSDAGARPEQRMITYCGGAIAASSTAFAAVMAGYSDVAVYDGSLSEWVLDPSLPMETSPKES